MSLYAVVISLAHIMMKFPVEDEKSRVVGVGVMHGDQHVENNLSSGHEVEGAVCGVVNNDVIPLIV